MKVFDNVAFGLRARNDTENLESRVIKALKAVKLEDFSDRYPHELSGGQQQRVGFARAIVTKPACILFDEPLSALDAILRDQMRLEIKKLTSYLGITSIFVTHDQTEAMTMSDKIVLLNKGFIEQVGSAEEIYKNPKTIFTAKFIGRSNWLGEREMFRPQKASLEIKEGYKKFPALVKGVEFLGENYQLHLDADGNDWVIEAQKKYDIGSKLSIYINEDNILRF